jgi:hypothetical protein
MRLLKLFVALATMSIAGVAAAHAETGGPPWGPETPYFNLEAILRPAAGGPDSGFGHVRFRQPNDGTKIVYLDAWIRDLAPNHGYYLQRAVDTVVDDTCTGTNWLTLGQGTVAEAISTDEKGVGQAALFRDLAAVPLDMTFDIHFRVIDVVSSAVVLESGCYQFTVSQ